jgi:cytochrome c peroxidase
VVPAISAALVLVVGTSAAQTPLRLEPIRGLDEYASIPDNNTLTTEKVSLGRRLFFDSLLSRDRRVACVTCHQPAFAFADTVSLPRGAFKRIGKRNTPSIINRVYGRSFFWDGRAGSLEEQVLQPVQNSLELALPIGEAVARLRKDASYATAFAGVFHEGPTPTNLARALASYVRTIRSGDSRFDRYQAGDADALSVDERNGLALFRGKANCAACHSGPNFTDEKFHNTGVGSRTSDVGRYGVSRRSADRGAFKTPTLRDVGLSAPYMHDGSIATLDSVVAFYDAGGRRNPQLDPEIRSLGLSAEERRQLAAFLRALAGTR